MQKTELLTELLLRDSEIATQYHQKLKQHNKEYNLKFYESLCYECRYLECCQNANKGSTIKECAIFDTRE